MWKYIQDSVHKRPFLALVILFVVAGTVIAAYAATYYRVNAGIAKEVDEFGICKKVSNLSAGPDTFVPTKTDVEWGAFVSNTPSNISISACVVGGGGVPVTYGTYGTCYCQDLNPDGTDGDYSAFNVCGVIGGNCSWACNFQKVLPADGTINFITGCGSFCNNSGCS